MKKNRTLAAQHLETFAKKMISDELIGFLFEKGYLINRDSQRLSAFANHWWNLDSPQLSKMIQLLFSPSEKSSFLHNSTSAVAECGFQKSTQAAVAIYKSSGELGHWNANYCSNRLAMMYHLGIDLHHSFPMQKTGALEFSHGTAADKLARAIKLFKQAINKSRTIGDSHCTAMNNLAVLLEHAEDAGDIQEAVDQYSVAVKTKLSPVADYNFGVFLAFGSPSHANR
eukprot:IDg4189t1